MISPSVRLEYLKDLASKGGLTAAEAEEYASLLKSTASLMEAKEAHKSRFLSGIYEGN